MSIVGSQTSYIQRPFIMSGLIVVKFAPQTHLSHKLLIPKMGESGQPNALNPCEGNEISKQRGGAEGR